MADEPERDVVMRFLHSRVPWIEFQIYMVDLQARQFLAQIPDSLVISQILQWNHVDNIDQHPFLVVAQERSVGESNGIYESVPIPGN
jgi:hypothetical protein